LLLVFLRSKLLLREQLRLEDLLRDLDCIGDLVRGKDGFSLDLSLNLELSLDLLGRGNTFVPSILSLDRLRFKLDLRLPTLSSFSLDFTAVFPGRSFQDSRFGGALYSDFFLVSSFVILFFSILGRSRSTRLRREGCIVGLGGSLLCWEEYLSGSGDRSRPLAGKGDKSLRLTGLGDKSLLLAGLRDESFLLARFGDGSLLLVGIGDKFLLPCLGEEFLRSFSLEDLFPDCS